MKHFTSKLLFFVFCMFITTNSFASVDLNSAQTQSFLKNVETYVNSLKKISGTFTQSSSNGATDAGKFYIDKPGKMRLEYESPILLVADGNSIVYEDKKLDQISYISMNSNPASIILNGDVKITGKNSSVKVKDIVEKDGFSEITLSTPNEKQSGTITLIFETKPLSLYGWRVRDAQGITTNVHLSNIKPETSFSSNLFKITRSKSIGSKKNKSKYY